MSTHEMGVVSWHTIVLLVEGCGMNCGHTRTPVLGSNSMDMKEPRGWKAPSRNREHFRSAIRSSFNLALQAAPPSCSPQ